MPAETVQTGALPQAKAGSLVATEGSGVPWRPLADEDSCLCHKACQRGCKRDALYHMGLRSLHQENWRRQNSAGPLDMKILKRGKAFKVKGGTSCRQNNTNYGGCLQQAGLC